MFRGYLHADERYRKCFSDGLYLTGDLATRDADGYFWFVGRKDDVIKSAGHLIGREPDRPGTRFLILKIAIDLLLLLRLLLLLLRAFS